MAIPLIVPKARQGIKMDPTDDAHMTTHQPPESYKDSGDQSLADADGYKHMTNGGLKDSDGN